MTAFGNSRPPKRNVAIISGATIGVLSIIIVSALVTLLIRRRHRFRLLEDREQGLVCRMAWRDDPPPIEPFTLKYASSFASESQDELTFPSDDTPTIPLEETETSESLEASNLPNPTDVSSASNLTPSILSTIRQQRLQEQGQASAMQLASLEERIGSSEWVSRLEYDALVAEMTSLRAEMSWIRDAQQSDWALGLSDEMPPPYSHSEVNSEWKSCPVGYCTAYVILCELMFMDNKPEPCWRWNAHIYI
jgi:hypothetical protein